MTTGSHSTKLSAALHRWLTSAPAIAAGRLLIVYTALTLCRVIFYLYNAPILGGLGDGQFWPLLKGSLVFDTASICYINALYIFLALLPFRAGEKRWYRNILFGYWIAVNGAAVAISLADAVYFRYAQKRFTADEIFFAGNDNTGVLILKFALENWYLALAVAGLIAAMVWAYRRRAQPKIPVANRTVYAVVCTALLAGAMALCVGGIRGGFSRSVRPITLSNATLYTPSPQKANLILSNPFCIIRTIGNSAIHYQRYFSEEELETIFTPLHAAQYPFFPSLGKRNIVIFILESFSAEHSALLNPDLYPQGGGYTPFLDSLMRGGYTLASAFSNGYKSIDALPAIFTSIPSFKTPFVLLPQSLGETRGLPKILDDEGYQTAFFCGSPRGSMGFGAYATAAGIKRLYSQEDYEQAHGRGARDGYWGIWDEPFLGYMAETLGTMQQPFFASVFTLSSHHPFVVPEAYRDVLPEGITRIHKGVAYTDLALRHFFEQAAQEEWFRNSIFVFAADHVSSEIFAPKSFTSIGRGHIILFFYTPDGALRGMDNIVAQQIDIMPTLLGLIGYDKPYFAFGRNILNEPERMPMAVNYTNQAFQGITDSVAIFFDEKRVSAAYARSDTLQRNNLAGTDNDAIRRAERQIKAVIQQYYRHLEQKNYTVKTE